MTNQMSFSRALIKEMRFHQWAKNALVALPVVLAPGVPTAGLFKRAAVAALAFSLCASAGYVLNDLLDIEADRAHQTKKHRPFASGALSPRLGPPLCVALLALGFGGSLWLLPKNFSITLAIYFTCTLGYSLLLKRVLIVDVLVLAGLYTLRIVAGGIATSIEISSWLLGFSIFLFLSLAFAKRYVELAQLEGEAKIKNRNYYKADLEMVRAMGPASGYLAALVFSLYVELGTHRDVYREPLVLWLAIPVLLYWVSRIWILAGRDQMQDDPVKFALKDWKSILCGVIIAALAAFARFTPDWLTALLHS